MKKFWSIVALGCTLITGACATTTKAVQVVPQKQDGNKAVIRELNTLGYFNQKNDEQEKVQQGLDALGYFR